MSRKPRLVLGLIFCVAVIASAAIAPAAVAQEGPTNETNDTDEEPTYLIAIDENVRVVEAEMVSQGTMSLTLEADQQTEIAITDASQEIQDMEAVQINREIRTIPEGTTEVTFSVDNADQPAVTIDTGEGLIGIGDQNFEQDRPAVDWSIVQLLLASTAIGSVALVFRVVKKNREDENMEAERFLSESHENG